MGDYAHAWQRGRDGRWHRVLPRGRGGLRCGALPGESLRRYWMRGYWPPEACEACAASERQWAQALGRERAVTPIVAEAPPLPGRLWARRRPEGAWHLVAGPAEWLAPAPAYLRACHSAVMRPPLEWVADSAEGVPAGACQQCVRVWSALHGAREDAS